VPREEVGRHGDHHGALAALTDVCADLWHPGQPGAGGERIGDSQRCQFSPQLVNRSRENPGVDLPGCKPRFQLDQLPDGPQVPGDLQTCSRPLQQCPVHIEDMQDRHSE
jgi:hypothetical protein